MSLETIHNYRGYVFTITFRTEDPWYSVDFPDIPEIITSGPTLKKAFANACEALDLCLETLEQLGRPLPAVRHRLLVKNSHKASRRTKPRVSSKR